MSYHSWQSSGRGLTSHLHASFTHIHFEKRYIILKKLLKLAITKQFYQRKRQNCTSLTSSFRLLCAASVPALWTVDGTTKMAENC